MAFALIASYLPISLLSFNAAETETEITVSSHSGLGTKTADEPTVNNWKEFFGKNVLHTDNAGTVWTDKSVFTSVSDYLEATDESEPSNFDL